MPTCTWNPSDKGANITLSGGNLVATAATSANAVRATISNSAGKWYWECKVTANVTNAFTPGFGTAAMSLTAQVGGSAISFGIENDGSTIRTGGPVLANAAGTSFAVNDVINFAIDLDAGQAWLGKNGTWTASGNPAAGTNPWVTFTANLVLFPAWSGNVNTESCTANFGTTAFASTPPTGFNAWTNTFYTVALTAGSYAITGNNAALSSARRILCAAGSYAITGIAIAPFSAVNSAILRAANFVLQQLRVTKPTLRD